MPKPTKQHTPQFEIVIYHDSETPHNFVVNLIEQTFALPRYDVKTITHKISLAGQWSFGPYPENIAKAIHASMQAQIEQDNHPLLVECLDLARPDSSGAIQCSFCGKVHTAVRHMFTGQGANICDQCVVSSSSKLYDMLPTAAFRYCYELLDWHFGSVALDNIVKTTRTYPGRVRADLQTAIDRLFAQQAIRHVGIHQKYGHEKMDITALWATGRNAQGIAPLAYEEVDIGEAAPKACQMNGLWLMSQDDSRYAAVLSRDNDYQGGYKIQLEISGPQGEDTLNVTRHIFDAIEQEINQALSYRGKVLSLEQADHYAGQANGITVHRIDAVQREQVILPEPTLAALDRTIIRFCQQRDQLRALGLPTKRGVMLYGPPGTGKTHTIRYLATQLKSHTTFLVTAEQIALLPEYFTLARLLQPVIFVIEDADLLAKAREHLHGAHEEALLNHLLNEMDGLKEDADILFVLSTNKPETLEEALIARPGRIDQLIEFTKPDAQCRSRLIQLYAGELQISNNLAEDIILRTEGVTASFIKELMRRLAQYSIERQANGVISAEDVEQALAEMLLQNNQFNREILGYRED